MTSAFIAFVEERGPTGVIAETPLAAFFSEGEAEEWVSQYNTDPRTEPRTADVVEVPLLGSELRVSGKPASSRAQRLDPEKVLAIRAAAAAGRTNRELGIEYGVSDQAISDVVTGKSWSWVL